MAQLVVMSMMRMGLFGGSILAAGGSLMGHLLFGVVPGLAYGATAVVHETPQFARS